MYWVIYQLIDLLSSQNNRCKDIYIRYKDKYLSKKLRIYLFTKIKI